MIEIRSESDKWVMVNVRDIKCIVFDRLPHDRKLFKVTIMYYGDEGELAINGALTEDECSTFRLQVSD